jgi:hypothetical protein
LEISDDASLLITLMRDVARSFSKASIYRPIRRLAEINPTREPRLFRFARGQYSRGRGILWTSQQRRLERLLADSSFALCTPTGSGKTLVANLALMKELLLTDVVGLPPLALYLVPSRALAGRIVSGCYAEGDGDKVEAWLFKDAPRTLRLSAIEKLPELLAKLSKEASATATLIRSKLSEAQEVAAAVKNAGSGPAPAEPRRVVRGVFPRTPITDAEPGK